MPTTLRDSIRETPHDGSGRRIEILVDDATGQIRKMRTLENGRLRALTVREYVQSPVGMLVLASERTTRYPRGDSLPPLVITMAYRNIQMREVR